MPLESELERARVSELVAAVEAGDRARVRLLLNGQPELIRKDLSENNEHRALHFAVLRRDLAMVRLLMEAGADARKGIFPHRDATSAYVLARDRQYGEIVAAIEEEEQQRRAELSCPNATVTPLQERINGAIRAGDDDTVLELLEEDKSLIQACDRGGRTPLHVAAEAGNLRLVNWLLERRADVRKQDAGGRTALDLAALAVDPREGNASAYPALAKALLAKGATLTIRAAVASADGARVRELVEADPNLLRQIDPAGGLVSLAVKHGQLATVRLLLELGADVDERIRLEQVAEPVMSWGMPLWYAALKNDEPVTRLLLDRGADPNANVYASGWPLRNAWNHDDGRVRELLLERGAKPQPYMLAEACEVAGARQLLADDKSEATASELLWSASQHGCPEIVALALAQIDWPASDRRWHWVIIQPMRGAEADAARNDGQFASLELLLRHGVDPNVSRYGQTALHFAAAYAGPISDVERARFAELLLRYGAALTPRDDLLKSTPLGWACRWGRVELAKGLLAYGAPVREADAEDWAQPKKWAEKMGQKRIQELLDGK